MELNEADLRCIQQEGIVSSYRRYETWYKDFCEKLPSYQDGILLFTFVANRAGKIRYSDGYQKNNHYIPKILPKVYYIDAQRNLNQFQENILMLQEDELLKQMRSGCCMFERAKKCNHCFSCIGLLYQKKTEELNAFETAKLLDYKLYQLNLDTFSQQVNDNFRKNGGNEQIFLHPKLQKVSGDILYRLSKGNPVIFSTHSPNLLANFNSRQIRQMIQGEDGYSANDLMNVNFVFIVEGKQDKTRLPLLLKKYYAETYDKEGNLLRIAIVTTNSCTNIKTYANLKYMNQIYLKDNFLMIRDGDGKDSAELKRQLCRYYADRNLEDIKNHMEEIKIYLRGHNLYDILDAIERFILRVRNGCLKNGG